MATLKDVMLESINKAVTVTEAITEPMDKAKAFLDLAHTCSIIAQQVGLDIEFTVEQTKNEAAPRTTATRKRRVAAAEEPKTVTEPVEVKQKVEQSEPIKKTQEKKTVKTTEELDAEECEFTEKWTPNALEYFATDIEEIQRYSDMFADDIESFNKVISDATNGTATEVNQVNPLNIRLVLSYIRNLEEAQSEGE